MPSNNQINNELEFTPTFGTQQREYDKKVKVMMFCKLEKVDCNIIK
jgi:hypothetical protein